MVHRLKKATAALRGHLQRDKAGLALLSEVECIGNDMRKETGKAKEEAEQATSGKTHLTQQLSAATKERDQLRMEKQQLADQLRAQKRQVAVHQREVVEARAVHERLLDRLMTGEPRLWRPEYDSQVEAMDHVTDWDDKDFRAGGWKRERAQKHWKHIPDLPKFLHSMSSTMALLRGVKRELKYVPRRLDSYDLRKVVADLNETSKQLGVRPAEYSLEFSVYNVLDLIPKLNTAGFLLLGKLVAASAIMNFPVAITCEPNIVHASHCDVGLSDKAIQTWFDWFHKNVDWDPKHTPVWHSSLTSGESYYKNPGETIRNDDREDGTTF